MRKDNLKNIIQISSLQNTQGGTSMIALCSDSSMWEKMITFEKRGSLLEAEGENAKWKLINDPKADS